jgi:hypothetical protein
LVLPSLTLLLAIQVVRLPAVASVTPAHNSVISLGIPVATAVNVAGAGFVDDVAKLTVAVSV